MLNVSQALEEVNLQIYRLT